MRFALVLILLALSMFADNDGAGVIGMITSALKDTEYKTPYSQWIPATQGQNLFYNYEVQGSEGGEYSTELYQNGSVEFPDGPASVNIGYFFGEAEFKDTQGQSYKLEPNSTLVVTEISSVSAIVPISITGSRTVWKPRGWGGRDSE